METCKPVSVIFSQIDTSNLTKLHISLLILLKSELNMSERLKIYISTTKNVLIELNPHIEIPLNLEDFTSMIEYALSKLKIKDDKGTVLLSVIKNKINEHLPPNVYKLRLDFKGQKFEYKDLDCRNVDYALFCNLQEGEDMESVRLSDFKMDLIGVSTKIISTFENITH